MILEISWGDVSTVNNVEGSASKSGGKYGCSNIDAW
jgi:hypothetical protein